MGWHEERFTPRTSRHHVECETCGRDMWLPKSKLAMHRNCSAECRDAAKGKEIEARARPCETCGTVFTPRRIQVTKGVGRYCSQACNTASREALLSDESKAKAKAAQAEMRARGEMNMAKGARSPNWSGGVYRSGGYILLKTDGRYVPEHRLVMERHLGRALRNDEVVHHINHDKADNRIENLQVMSRAEHMDEHRDDLLEGLRRAGK